MPTGYRSLDNRFHSRQQILTLDFASFLLGLFLRSSNGNRNHAVLWRRESGLHGTIAVAITAHLVVQWTARAAGTRTNHNTGNNGQDNRNVNRQNAADNLLGIAFVDLTTHATGGTTVLSLIIGTPLFGDFVGKRATGVHDKGAFVGTGSAIVDGLFVELTSQHTQGSSLGARVQSGDKRKKGESKKKAGHFLVEQNCERGTKECPCRDDLQSQNHELTRVLQALSATQRPKKTARPEA